jgi:hypothetical protein
MEKGTLPLGFAMALAQDERALRRYGALTDAERQAVMQKVHAASSKREMQRLVSELAEGHDGSGVI